MKEFLRRVVLSSPQDYQSLKEHALDLMLAMSSEAILTSAEIRQKKAMMDLGITAFDHTEIQNFIHSNMKISAIKRLREITRKGLKESKDACDNSEYFSQSK